MRRFSLIEPIEDNTMININDVTERRKALWPELFMSAEERQSVNARMQEKMDTKMAVENQLGQSADALWKVVAPNAVDAVSKKYFDLANTTHTVETGLSGNTRINPVVQVEVVKGAGAALKDATDWNDSALENEYVPVKLHRYSRPFALYADDIMRGERIETKLGAAVEAVVASVVNDYFATVAASGAAEVEASADVFGPEFVTQNLAPVFGDCGDVDDLVLCPTLHSKLIPVNALSLGTEPGTYGIGKIHKSAGLNVQNPGMVSTEGVLGVAVRKNGVAAGFGVPDLSQLEGVAVRSLGTVAGIPLVLKSWVDAGTECIRNSVEAMAGFAVANKDGICLVKAEA